MTEPLLRITGLAKHYPVRLGAYGGTSAVVRALDDFTAEIREGETLSLVGESGCGKSTTGHAILNLQHPTAGSVTYKGTDLARLDDAAMRPFRRELQIVFQDPYSTLNPRRTIGQTLAEPILFHSLASRAEIPARLRQLLADVGLTERFAARYPHELSGGQRQRVAIARALACQPRFVVCDEAISALDVSVQAQILNLLMDLQEKYCLTYLFIAHDLAVVRHISDRVGVMYLGRLAELAPAGELFARALHPYTRALLSAVPVADPRAPRNRQRLTGEVPSPLKPPSGCRFHARCPLAREICRAQVPVWREVAPDHHVACHAVSGPDRINWDGVPA